MVTTFIGCSIGNNKNIRQRTHLVANSNIAARHSTAFPSFSPLSQTANPGRIPANLSTQKKLTKIMNNLYSGVGDSQCIGFYVSQKVGRDVGAQGVGVSI
jgi:hypothetical protein